MSVFYCFLNSEVRTRARNSGRQEACWDQRLSVAASCLLHTNSVLPAPSSWLPAPTGILLGVPGGSLPLATQLLR